MEILNSWKEIANYLGRGVRTVQRWERDFGLPVHRPKGKDRSAVLAFPAEIDRWLHRTPVRGQVHKLTVSAPAEPQPRIAEARPGSHVALMRESLARSRRLLAALHEEARRHQTLTCELCESLRQLGRGQIEQPARGRQLTPALPAAGSPPSSQTLP
jgi:hypothetical protein